MKNVLSISNRARVVRWMCQDFMNGGGKFLLTRYVKVFPDLFRGIYNANVTQASRIWRDLGTYVCEDAIGTMRGTTPVITCVTKTEPKLIRLKSRGGRDRKRSTCVNSLHRDLREYFDRLRKLGVKFNQSVICLYILRASQSFQYRSNMLDPSTGRILH